MAAMTDDEREAEIREEAPKFPRGSLMWAESALIFLLARLDAERKRAEGLQRALDRWTSGTQIEGDYVDRLAFETQRAENAETYAKGLEQGVDFWRKKAEDAESLLAKVSRFTFEGPGGWFCVERSGPRWDVYGVGAKCFGVYDSRDEAIAEAQRRAEGK